jgi:soluble lytic murein transglycosylase-like protein
MDRQYIGAVVLAAFALGLFGALLFPSSLDLAPFLAEDTRQDQSASEPLRSLVVSWLNPLVKTAKLLQHHLQMPGDLAVEVAASIHRHTKARNIAPELVVAVIKVESGGNPRAVSHKRAVGLMQVHYPVWGKVLGVSYEELFDIDTNIGAGIHILNHYMERYEDLNRALAAYGGNLRSKQYSRKVLRAYRQLGQEI